MGCICSKGTSAKEYVENHSREKVKKKTTKRNVAVSKRDEVVAEIDNGVSDATTRLISTEPTEENVVPTSTAWNEGEKKSMAAKTSFKPQLQRRTTMDVGGGQPQISKSTADEGGGQPQISRLFSTRDRADEGPAGWPTWLSAVAGEAIKGWVPRKAESFEKLDKIGQGTYSSVYRARDLETGKIVALKKVRFVNMDPESVRFMAREILILRRLDHPNIMKLEGLVTSRVSGNLYLVFEYMEHDLAGLAASATTKFTEAQIKCYMQQLFRGLEHCHSQGVLHRDIKGSNLLIDNKGNLKIGDFGLATFFRSNQKQPLTSRVVTLWYRPPELLLGATDYGVSVDLWSAGCILAELFAGKPIMPGRTEVEQLHKIFKLCGSPSEEYWQRSKLPHSTIFKPQQPYKRCFAETYKDLPPTTLSLLEILLAVEPENRGTAASALGSEFFTSKPFPCEPSSLPKYPPSKEFDAKLRDEEARRQRAAGGKGRGNEPHRKGSKESKAIPAPDANAELQESIQKRKGQPNPKSVSEKFNGEEDGASGFPLEPFRGTAQNRLHHSGQLVQSGISESFVKTSVKGGSLLTSQLECDSSRNGPDWRTRGYYQAQGAVQLSRFSSSVAVRGSSQLDLSRDTSVNTHWPVEGSESSVNHESSHLLFGRTNHAHKEDEQAVGKESKMVYALKKNRMHYSGPLIPPGGSIEEMLKEHEKQIQRAVRKANQDKTKTKKGYGDNILTESLLHGGKG